MGGSKRPLVSWIMVAVLLGACAAESGDPTSSELDGRILVSAAASLTEGFAEVESAFEAEHPGVDVILNLGGSSRLREQILEGAPVDVFASADVTNMDRVSAAGRVVGPARIFATNELRIAVPVGNPGEVTGLEDFARTELLIGLCAEGVPCGDFARQVLAGAGVAPAVDTDEPDVRALLTKIEAGELDIGITYVTDIASTDGAVQGVDIPLELNVVVEYPIARLAGAPNPEAAATFVDFVLSGQGREILAGYGFGSP